MPVYWLCERLSAIGSHPLPVLADAVIRGAVILALAAMGTLALRKASAATRHWVWFLGILGVLALPILSAALPGWYILPRWANHHGGAERAAPVPIFAAPPDSADTVPPIAANAPAVYPSAPALLAPPSTPALAAPRAHLTWQGCVLLAWAAGSALILGYVAMGFVSLFFLRRRSARITNGNWPVLLSQACGQIGFRRPVELLSSPERTMPMTWGLYRTRLLLPEDSGSWTLEQRRAVLLHELSHAKRWDCLTQLFAQIACALYWFNPLAWLAWKRMQSEREQACDDLVLSSGTQASAYAEQLLHIASEMPAVRFSAAAIAMARPSKLEGRLRAILDITRNRRKLTRMGVLIAAALLVLVITPLACMHAAPEATAEPNLASANGDAFALVRMDRVGEGLVGRTMLVGRIDGGQAAMRQVPIPAEVQRWDTLGVAGGTAYLGRLYLQQAQQVKTLDLASGTLGEFAGGAPALRAMGMTWAPTMRGKRELWWDALAADHMPYGFALYLRSADGTSKKVWGGEQYMQPILTNVYLPVPPIVWLDDQHALTVRVQDGTAHPNPNLANIGPYILVVVDLDDGTTRDIGSIPWSGSVNLVAPRGADGDAMAILNGGIGSAATGKSLAHTYAINVRSAISGDGKVEERPVQWGAFTLDGVEEDYNNGYEPQSLSVQSLACAGKVLAKDVVVSVSPDGRCALWQVRPKNPNIGGWVSYLFESGGKEVQEVTRGDALGMPVWFTADADTAEQAQISGVVVASDGKPVENAQVELQVSDHDGGLSVYSKARSGSDGRFALPLKNPTAARGQICAFVPGAGISLPIQPPVEGSPRLTLMPAVDAHITVLAPDGKPAPGVGIRPIQVIFHADTGADTGFGQYLRLPEAASQGFSGITDANGTCIIHGLPRSALVRFTVDDKRYAQLSIVDDASLAGGGSVIDIKPIQLKKAASISGTVINPETHKPISEMEVDVQEFDANSDGAGGMAVSDSQGRYVINRIRPGSYVVSMGDRDEERNEWAAAALDVTLAEGEHSTANLILTRGGILKGQVRDAGTGKPLPGATVGLHGSGRPEQAGAIYSRTTDGQGRYIFRVPPGVQHPYIAGEIDGYLIDSTREMQDVKVEEGRSVEANFDLKPDPTPVIEGTVLGPDGKPVAGATVICEMTEIFPSNSVQSDAQGRFRIRAKSGAPLRARWEDLATITAVPAPQSSVPVELRLQPKASFTLTVRLIDESGWPVIDAAASLTRWSGDHGISLSPCQADAEGKVRFEKLDLDTTYSVSAEGGDYGVSQASVKNPPAKGAREATVTLALHKLTAQIAGVVVDENGRPISGITVTMNGGDTGVKEMKTDAAGRFSFRVVAGASAAVFLRTDPNLRDAVAAMAGDTDLRLVFRREQDVPAATQAATARPSAATIERRKFLENNLGTLDLDFIPSGALLPGGKTPTRLLLTRTDIIDDPHDKWPWNAAARLTEEEARQVVAAIADAGWLDEAVPFKASTMSLGPKHPPGYVLLFGVHIKGEWQGFKLDLGWGKGFVERVNPLLAAFTKDEAYIDLLALIEQQQALASAGVPAVTQPASQPDSAAAGAYLDRINALLPKGWSATVEGNVITIKRDQEARGLPLAPNGPALLPGEDAYKSYPVEIILNVGPRISPAVRQAWVNENDAAAKQWYAEHHDEHTMPLSPPVKHILPTHYDDSHSVRLTCWELDPDWFKFKSQDDAKECRQAFDAIAGLFHPYPDAAAPATEPATQPASLQPAETDDAANVPAIMGLDGGSNGPTRSGWVDLGKRNLQIKLDEDDKADAGLRAIGTYPQRAALSLPEVYQQAVTGKIAAGHQALVGRMEGPYLDGDEFIVSGFVRKGNRVVAYIQYVHGPQGPGPSGRDHWKRAYFRGQIPQNLPPGRYYVWIELREYLREGGKLTLAPMTAMRAFEYLTCMFDAPDPTGKEIAWQMPGSAISVAEAMKQNFAFAVVCDGDDMEGRFQFADPGSNYVPDVFSAIQRNQIVEVLAGDAKPGGVQLVYHWTDTDQRHEACPAKQKVIWIVGKPAVKGSVAFCGVKALADTPANRQAIREAAVIPIP